MYRYLPNASLCLQQRNTVLSLTTTIQKMMNFCVGALFIGLIVSVNCGFSDEEMVIIKKMSEGCMEQTGVAQDLVMKAKEGVFESDPKFQEYMFCMFKSPGFMNDAGDYQTDVMQGMMEQKMDAGMAKQIVEECTKFTGDKLEKAMQLAKCMYAKKN